MWTRPEITVRFIFNAVILLYVCHFKTFSEFGCEASKETKPRTKPGSIQVLGSNQITMGLN